jgi:hypothetical protein
MNSTVPILIWPIVVKLSDDKGCPSVRHEHHKAGAPLFAWYLDSCCSCVALSVCYVLRACNLKIFRNVKRNFVYWHNCTDACQINLPCWIEDWAMNASILLALNVKCNHRTSLIIARQARNYINLADTSWACRGQTIRETKYHTVHKWDSFKPSV